MFAFILICKEGKREKERERECVCVFLFQVIVTI